MHDVTDILARTRAGIRDPTITVNGDTPSSMLIDWPTFWNVDHNTADWLLEPVIAHGRSHALYAPGGEGKSLLALWLAVQAATGTPTLAHHRPRPPINVLYLDYEMTLDDLAERLESMGYGPETDLTHLHYALLPPLAPLDTPEGGKAVVELAQQVDAQLAVIDTFARAVQGNENDADTVRAWYRWTGLHLKAEGRSFVRVDHAGKDLDKGQRGSSAKNDDVDIVWQMTRGDNDTYTLKAKKRRMGWVPDEVRLTRRDDPLRYELVGGPVWPAGTAELANILTALEVPFDTTTREATDALKASGRRIRRASIVAAVRYRREGGLTVTPVDNTVDNPVDNSGNQGGNHAPTPTPELTPEPTPNTHGNQPGTSRNQGPSHTGNQGPPLKGDPVPEAAQKHPDYTQPALPEEPEF